MKKIENNSSLKSLEEESNLNTTKKHSKSLIAEYVVFGITLVCFIFAVVFFIISPSGKDGFLLGLIQRLAMIIILFVPMIIEKIFKIKFPPFFNISLYIFFIMAVFIGTFMNIYAVFRHWDTILHGLSACLFGFLSMCLIAVWFKNKNIELSPIFLLLFAFCFSLAIEAVWEIYEYTVDAIIEGYNAQRYIENGIELVGRAALYDTMKDIIIGAIGALIAGIVCAICQKKNKNFINAFEIKKVNKKQPIKTENNENSPL